MFSGVRVTRSLALCVCFVDRCLSLCTSNSCTDRYIIVYNDVLLSFLFDTTYPFRHNANMILNVELENVAITTKDPWL